MTECRREQVIYGITGKLMFTIKAITDSILLIVSPDHLKPFFMYANGAINVQGLSSMIASNGTTGMIMVCVTCVDMMV